MLSGELICNLDDLNIFSTLRSISDFQGRKVVQNIEHKIIAAVRPKNEAEFYELAEICASMNLYQLKEQSLVRMLIWNFF